MDVFFAARDEAITTYRALGGRGGRRRGAAVYGWTEKDAGCGWGVSHGDATGLHVRAVEGKGEGVVEL